MNTYIAGLDLGQQQDYTALTIMERHGDRPAEYHCRWLERWKKHTPYTAIVEDVNGKLRTLPQQPARPYLILDATGVGRGIVDMFRVVPNLPAQLRAVTITGGMKPTQEGAEYTVPKTDLVAVVQVLLQANPARLQIANGIAAKQIVIDELANFQRKVTEAGHATYGAGPLDNGARDGIHDDMVLAVALACWWGERGGLVNARAIGDGSSLGRQWTRAW